METMKIRLLHQKRARPARRGSFEHLFFAKSHSTQPAKELEAEGFAGTRVDCCAEGLELRRPQMGDFILNSFKLTHNEPLLASEQKLCPGRSANHRHTQLEGRWTSLTARYYPNLCGGLLQSS